MLNGYKHNLQLGYGPMRMARAQRPFNSYDIEGMLGAIFTNLKNEAGHNVGRMFGLLLLILIGASLLGPVANATTGITIAHTGFTPNANVTATPGFVPLIQVLPLVFVGVLLGFAIDELTSVL